MGTSYAHIRVSSKRVRDSEGNPMVVLSLVDAQGDHALVMLNRDAAQAVAATLMRAAVVQTEDDISVAQVMDEDNNPPPQGDNVIRFKH